MTDLIKASNEAGVLTLVIDRPAKKNSLTDAMYKSLADALEAADRDATVRVVLLRGEGDAFTAGNDLGEFAASAAQGGSLPVNTARFLHALAALSKPLVAAVQGRAVGVGTTMLLHCDQVILAENALLSAPFVNLALVPEAASSLLLPARIGYARAFAVFALGEPIKAQDALAWGIANAVVPVEQLVATASDLAKKLAARPLGSLQATKTLMRDAAQLSRQIDVENDAFAARLRTAEAQEAFAAFAERRTPDFSKFT